MNNEKNITIPFIKLPGNIQSNFVTGKREITTRNWTVWHIGAGIGLLGGLVILLGTAFLIIFEYFANEKPIGMWLFLFVLPLWIFGAHCFDKVDDLEKKAKREYFKTLDE